MDLDKHNFRCIASARCRLRSCSHCSTARGHRIGFHLNQRTAEANGFHHVTLTLPPSCDGPAKQVRLIQSAFKNLRRRIAWTTTFMGGVGKVEATHKRNGGLWHVHLHIFAMAACGASTERFAAITETWTALTSATVTDFKPITTDEYRTNTAYYVAKAPQSDLIKRADADALREWINATKGMRLISTFGDWRGKPLLPRYTANTATAQTVDTVSDSIHATCNNRYANEQISDSTLPPTTAVFDDEDNAERVTLVSFAERTLGLSQPATVCDFENEENKEKDLTRVATLGLSQSTLRSNRVATSDYATAESASAPTIATATAPASASANGLTTMNNEPATIATATGYEQWFDPYPIDPELNRQCIERLAIYIATMKNPREFWRVRDNIADALQTKYADAPRNRLFDTAIFIASTAYSIYETRLTKAPRMDKVHQPIETAFNALD